VLEPPQYNSNDLLNIGSGSSIAETRLTPWSRVLVEMLIVAELVKTFLTFHGNRICHRVHMNPSLVLLSKGPQLFEEIEGKLIYSFSLNCKKFNI
jgi:hypothetical protein